MRRATRKLRSTPLISMRNSGRYETIAQERDAFDFVCLFFYVGAGIILKYVVLLVSSLKNHMLFCFLGGVCVH